MVRTSLLSLAVVLMVSSGALAGIAGITQNQGFTIGSTNLMTLLQGKNIANNINLGIITNGQTAISSCGLWAIQDDNAIFTQKGRAIGACSLIGVVQNGTVIGQQFQLLVGCCGQKAQGQGLVLNLGQELTKSNGEGTAIATHEFFGDRLQALGSVSGSMNEDQFVSVTQDSNIHGEPCADGRIAGTVYVSTNQAQAID